MNSDIANLVKLQEIDDVIRALDSRLAQIPIEVRELEKEIADEKKSSSDAQERLAAAQKEQRAAEGELSSAEEKLAKYQDQLMNVKSNDEYKAMQRQIEVTKKEIGDIETKILQGLDALEELERKRVECEKALSDGEERVTGLEKLLNEEKSKLENERAQRQQAREERVGLVPEDLLVEYEKIAGTRGGVAMAAAVEERCQACMVRVRPQVFQELRIGDTIHHCGSCNRILYFTEEEHATAT